jgi:hypothetical protein
VWEPRLSGGLFTVGGSGLPVTLTHDLLTGECIIIALCTGAVPFYVGLYTDKKENKIFLIYKEIQMGSGAKSYMRNGFLILYEEMHKYFYHTYMRRSLVIYDFAPDPSEFPIICGIFSFFFYQCIKP